MNLRLLLLAAVASTTGCATMHPVAHAKNFQLDAFGESSVAQQRTEKFRHDLVDGFATKAPGDATASAPEVKVFNHALPDGVTVASNGLVLATPESGYTVLGKFHFEPRGATTLEFAEYDSTAVRVACGANTVLTWATALVWQLLPVAWPCVVRAKLPLAEAEGFIRAATVAAGGDVAVIVEREVDEKDLFLASGYFLKAPATATADTPPAPSTTTTPPEGP